MEVEWLIEFHEVAHHISVDTTNDVLTIELEQVDSNEKWNASFPSKYVEEITSKAGNFKKFDVFLKMLISALNRESGSVSIELLTYSDLEVLKRKKIASQHLSSSTQSNIFSSSQPTSSSSLFHGSAHVDESFATQGSLQSSSTPVVNVNGKVNKKRYLILTFSSEFDRVHYPLPLSFQESPTVESLIRTIRRLKRQVSASDNHRYGNNENLKPSPNLGSGGQGNILDVAESRAYTTHIKELRKVINQLRLENKDLQQTIKVLENAAITSTRGGNTSRRPTPNRSPNPSTESSNTVYNDEGLTEVLTLNSYLRKQVYQYQSDIKELSTAFETLRIDAAKEISGLKAKLRAALSVSDENISNPAQSGKTNNSNLPINNKAPASSLPSSNRGGYSDIDFLKRRVLSLERDLRLERSLNSSTLNRAQGSTTTATKSTSHNRTRSKSADSSARGTGSLQYAQSQSVRYPTPQRRYERKPTPPHKRDPPSYDNIKSSGYGYNQPKSRPSSRNSSRNSSRGSSRSLSPSTVDSTHAKIPTSVPDTYRRPSPSQYIQSLSNGNRSLSSRGISTGRDTSSGIASTRSRSVSPQVSRLDELTDSLLQRLRATGGSRERATGASGTSGHSSRPPWGAGRGLTGSNSRPPSRERESGYSSAHSQSSRGSRTNAIDQEYDRRITRKRDNSTGRGVQYGRGVVINDTTVVSDIDIAYSKTEKWTRRLQERQARLDSEKTHQSSQHQHKEVPPNSQPQSSLVLSSHQGQDSKQSINESNTLTQVISDADTDTIQTSSSIHPDKKSELFNEDNKQDVDTHIHIRRNQSLSTSQVLSTSVLQSSTTKSPVSITKTRVSKTKDPLLDLIEQSQTQTHSPIHSTSDSHSLLQQQQSPHSSQAVQDFHMAFLRQSKDLPSFPNTTTITITNATAATNTDTITNSSQQQSDSIVTHSLPNLSMTTLSVFQPNLSASVELPKNLNTKVRANITTSINSSNAKSNPTYTLNTSMELPRKSVPKSQAPLLQSIQSPIKSPSTSQQLSSAKQSDSTIRASYNSHVTSPTHSLSDNIRIIKAHSRGTVSNTNPTVSEASDIRNSVTSESTDRLIPSIDRSFTGSPNNRRISTATTTNLNNSINHTPEKVHNKIRSSLRNSVELSEEKIRNSVRSSPSIKNVPSSKVNENSDLDKSNDNLKSNDKDTNNMDELSQIDKRILALQSYLDKARQGLRND